MTFMLFLVNDGSNLYFMDSISSRLMFKAAAMFSAGIPEAINVFIFFSSTLSSALLQSFGMAYFTSDSQSKLQITCSMAPPLAKTPACGSQQAAQLSPRAPLTAKVHWTVCWPFAMPAECHDRSIKISFPSGNPSVFPDDSIEIVFPSGNPLVFPDGVCIKV